MVLLIGNNLLASVISLLCCASSMSCLRFAVLWGLMLLALPPGAVGRLKLKLVLFFCFCLFVFCKTSLQKSDCQDTTRDGAAFNSKCMAKCGHLHKWPWGLTHGKLTWSGTHMGKGKQDFFSLLTTPCPIFRIMILFPIGAES